MDGSDGKKLSVKVRSGQAWTRFLEIEVPEDEVTLKLGTVYESFRRSAKIPGFRPGKVPMAIVKQRFADDVRAEALEQLLPEAIQKAMLQENLIPLGTPKVTDVEFDSGKSLKFKAEVEIQPEIKLNKYSGFKIEKKTRKITEKDYEEAIGYLRERRAEYHPVERASVNGDLVIVDLLKKHDKLGSLKEDKLENVEVFLGSEGILEVFNKELVGMSIGEMKNISVEYPADYPDRNLAGDTIMFTAVIKEIKRKELPELGDEFAASISKAKTLDELRRHIWEDLEKKAADEAERKLRSEIMRKVVDGNTFDVPISMLDKYLDSVVGDFKEKGEPVDENTVRRQYRPLGENLIRWTYLYHEIAKKEKIEVTQEERKKWVEGFARTYNVSEERAREYLGKSKRLQDMDESILEDKVIDFIKDNSEIINTQG